MGLVAAVAAAAVDNDRRGLVSRFALISRLISHPAEKIIMNHTASENYLVTEVMTATPPKLHLMLIDAAIRAGQRAQIHWQNKENEQAGKCVKNAQKIVHGILDGIDFKTNSELVAKVAGVYLFIHNSLARAFIDNDENKLAEALRVLAVERETWRQVCEIPAASTGEQSAPKTSRAPLAPDHFSNGGIRPDSPTASFSLEA